MGVQQNNANAKKFNTICRQKKKAEIASQNAGVGQRSMKSKTKKQKKNSLNFINI